MTKVIVRRKGRRYRTFDTTTARMGPWERIPLAPLAFIEGYAEKASERTVPELRGWLSAHRPAVRIPSKARKSDIIHALAQAAWDRRYSLHGVVGW